MYFDPGADQSDTRGYWITDDQLRKKLVNLIDTDEEIKKASIYSNPLSSWQLTDAIFKNTRRGRGRNRKPFEKCLLPLALENALKWEELEQNRIEAKILKRPVVRKLTASRAVTYSLSAHGL